MIHIILAEAAAPLAGALIAIVVRAIGDNNSCKEGKDVEGLHRLLSELGENVDGCTRGHL